MDSLCRIEMLGGLKVIHTRRTRAEACAVTRFSTRKTAALMAYLAYHFKYSPHPRELLIDMLWPEADLEAGRASLRTALASLRRQLEPPGVPAGSVLLADRFAVHLNPQTVVTDVAQFEAALKTAAKTGKTDSQARQKQLVHAAGLYTGDLLPGYYESWTLGERERLQREYLALTQEIAVLGEQEIGQVFAAASGLTSLESSLLEETALSLPPEMKPRYPAPHSFPDRLPLTLTRFFGREAELAHLQTLLHQGREDERARLVTLTGQGGAGKTRLAVETARKLSGSADLRVVFVPLADVIAPNLLVSEIADALRSHDAQYVGALEEDEWEQITQTLAKWNRVVMVLDNFEQLTTPEGAQVVRMLLERVPHLSCLVTSRQCLRVEGERELPLMPLHTPHTPDTPEHLLNFASVQLFLDRAQAIRPDFQITPRNARTIAQLCQKLEGIPLALELAAAWAQTLSPSQLLQRLERPLELLVSRHQTQIPRHQSLRAALEGSYQLLTPALQDFFARLSVFRGGWTLQAAETVCDAPDALDLLTKLRERSLLSAEDSEDDAGERRFRMAETVREYAWEQLDAEGRARSVRRHTAYFVVFAETSEPELRSEGVSQWLPRLEAEQENMRLVLAQAESDPESALRLAGALGRFWYLRGHWNEGRDWLYRVLEYTGASLPSRARALLAAATLAWTQDVYGEAERLCKESLEAHRNLEDKRGIAASLSLLGMLAVLKGDHKSGQSLLDDSVSLFREVGDRWGIAHTLDRLSYAVRDAGAYAQAEALDRQCLALRRELSDTHGIAVSISNLADLAFLRGEWEEAASLHAESLEGFRTTQDTNGIAYALGKLGMVALRAGEVAHAEELERESAALFWEMRDRRRLAGCLETFANIRHAQNRDTEAARLFSAADTLRESIGAPLTAAERVDWERSVAAMQAALGASAFTRAWAQGQILSLEQAVTSILQPQEKS